MPQKTISKLLESALKKAGYQKPAAGLGFEPSSDDSFGDYTSNVAFVIARERAGRESPRTVAEKIAARLKKRPGGGLFEKIEVAGAGFINFYLSSPALLAELNQVLAAGDRYGYAAAKAGKKLMIEYTDPNPFKEFHIGHLYSNVVGESLARLQEARGFAVKRANYQGDVGLHVAKALWGMQTQLSRGETTLDDLAQKPLAERIAFLGQAYARGDRAYEENKDAREQITRLNYIVYACGQRYQKERLGKKAAADYPPAAGQTDFRLDDIYPLWRAGRAWSLEHFDRLYRRLGTNFDYYYFESATSATGYKLVREFLEQGVFEKGQGGAIVFKGERVGLHTRVFVNARGLPTYEAKDLGLALIKYQDYPYDQSLIITGREVDQYFQVVLQALGRIRPDLAQKTRHLSHGMVRLPTGKMSSRTGNVITAEQLLAEVRAKVRQKMRETGADLDEQQKETAADQVTVGAVKYALLKSAPGGDIVFDLEQSINFEGDSGPYLQYSHARARGILRRAGSETSPAPPAAAGPDHPPLNQDELALLRWLYKFPRLTAAAAQKHAPQLVCRYLYELARVFNGFYDRQPVLKAGDGEQKEFRLRLTAAAAQVLKNGLRLLGIQAPARM